MKKLLFSLFALFTPFLYIYGNDTAGEVLPLGGVKFIKQENIEMLQEALLLKSSSVEVNYLFKNTSDGDITTTVLFPLPDMSCVAGYEDGPFFTPNDFNFKLWVDGKELEPQQHFNIENSEGVDFTRHFKHIYPTYHADPKKDEFVKAYFAMPKEEQAKMKKEREVYDEGKGDWVNIGCDDGNYTWCGFDCNLKVYYHWQQTFPAGKIVHIKHSYAPAAQFDSTGGVVYQYILKTAANWKMPIKQFNMLVFPGTGRFGALDQVAQKRCAEINGYKDAKAGDYGYQPCSRNETDRYIYYAADIKDFTPTDDITVSSAKQSGWGPNLTSARCAYEGGCTLFSMEDNTPLCRLKNLGDNEYMPIYSGELTGQAKDKMIIQYPLGTAKVSKFDNCYLGSNYKCYFLESAAGKEKKLPFCDEYLERFTGKENITPKLYQIDGPANLRATPNGKKTGSLEDKTYAWVVSKEGKWVNVIQNDKRGWTHSQNLIEIWK
ncbi:hypothetical protein Dip510_001512 [Elusimicrobium posterum]|uniref:DUF4424 family protein n=1 Tax=Elusimicrobium posterum TaxID=3116653 RepID=UPI003C752B6B